MAYAAGCTGVEAVGVPGLGEAPALLERKDGAGLATPSAAPATDVLFRPEEQHGPSGEDDVAVPVARRDGKMNHAAPARTARAQVSASDAHLHRFAAAAA